jgi:serine/threonine protein kinase
MKLVDIDIDKFIDRTIVDNGNEYVILEYLGKGAVGYMFHCRSERLDDNRAVKFIPGKLKKGWENEIIKVNKIKGQGHVVPYHAYNATQIDGTNYTYIVWDYISSDSFDSLIASKSVNIPLLIDVIKTVLEVLHACIRVNIVHADLHAGNILIEKENSLYMDASRRKVWVTDFGRLTQNSDEEYLDDFLGLQRIISQALTTIDYHELDGDGKYIYKMLKYKFSRCLMETNITVDDSVRNPQKILDKLQLYLMEQKKTGCDVAYGIGDYLAAEHLGDNFEEWEAIFVPKFIAINELMERNICVLTGLRGCGKTMLFKRLSAYFNLMIGDNANLVGSDQFYGFYLNARDIAETFPWLPNKLEDDAKNQLVHNFNLKWTLEILVWIRELSKNSSYDLRFLNHFFKKYYSDYFSIDNGIYYLIEKIRSEIEKSRLKSTYKTDNWVLTQYDYLEIFVTLIKEKMNLNTNKPFFFFLDDYSLPMVKETIQRILNPIVFRRSANVIFKISTESVESFERVSLNNKVLEENDDFNLIDCGMLTLTRRTDECKEILFPIISKRIERNISLKGKGLTLDGMLGKTIFNNEERAKIIRGEKIVDESRKKESDKYLYQGWKVFCDMWTSDIREMINLFADMVSSMSEDFFAKSNYIIPDEIQDTIYKQSGGQFMSLLEAATNPSEKSLTLDSEHKYAKHLISIVNGFHELASFELKNKKSKNLDHNPIKKARRIEIANVNFDLDEAAYDYYRGLIRYGIFIRDYRGKSVRGRIAPRLVLRSRLIPLFRLTFSKRDSITMSWNEFQDFLLKPNEFVISYKERNRSDQAIYVPSNIPNQPLLPFGGMNNGKK